MRREIRGLFDKIFTGFSSLSILLMAAALVIILGPMLWRGAQAVFFTGTVEFRQSQLYEDYAKRGDPEQIAEQTRQADQARQPLYDLLNEFALAVDVDGAVSDIKHYDRHVVRPRLRGLENNGAINLDQMDYLEDVNKDLRRDLADAFEATTYEASVEHIQQVRNFSPDPPGAVPSGSQREMQRTEEQYRTIVRAYHEKAEQFRKRLQRLVRLSDAARRKAGFGEAGRQIAEMRRQVARDLADRPELLEAWNRAANTLAEAFEADATYKARPLTEAVVGSALAEQFDPNQPAGRLFALAGRYNSFLDAVGLSKREAYGEPLAQLQEELRTLFGPPPGERAKSLLAESAYGATRWEEVLKYRNDVLYTTVWVPNPETMINEERQVPRAEQFDGKLDDLFAMLQDDQALEAMFLPQFTVYWQYFIDSSTPGHQFGGVGPEVAGTIAVTLLTILIALPLGIISAAYLVECTDKDNLFIRVIRTCINTLAGVPSIVFGLWGLAFVVMTVQPFFNLQPERSVFAGGLTMAALVLPIIIRSSEEAIRAVPPSYREAALSLGAGGFRTFVTVTLPAALPGVLTGVILSMSRAAGETAPLLFTAAAATQVGVFFPESIFQGEAKILSYTAYDIASGDRTAMNYPHKQYGVIMTLVMIVLLLNIAAIMIRSRVSRKLRG